MDEPARLVGGEERCTLLTRWRGHRRSRQRLQVLHPPEAPEGEASGGRLTELAEAARRQRGDPSVQPVGEEIEGSTELLREDVRRNRFQMAKAGP